MAREEKHSLVDNIIEIAAMFPWWVGLLLAIISHFVCHHFATAEIPPPFSTAQMGANDSGQIGKTFATYGQYLLPLIFLIGAGISAFKRQQKAELIEDVQESSSFAMLNVMSWREFEMLVGEAFRHKGFLIIETGSGGPDNGVNPVLRKDGQKYLVQCKHWKAYKIGVTTISELHEEMSATGATGGFIVTAGSFTQEAVELAEGINIKLIGGSELTSLIKNIQQLLHSTTAAIQPPPLSPSATNTYPNCPECGGSMTVRIAKPGTNHGKTFWGCTAFPQYRGVVAID